MKTTKRALLIEHSDSASIFSVKHTAYEVAETGTVSLYYSACGEWSSHIKGKRAAVLTYDGNLNSCIRLGDRVAFEVDLSEALELRMLLDEYLRAIGVKTKVTRLPIEEKNV